MCEILFSSAIVDSESGTVIILEAFREKHFPTIP